MSELTTNDFVYSRDQDGKVYSGGYKVESLLLEKGIPLITKNNQKGGGSILGNMVVPAGLLYVQQKATPGRFDTKNYGEVSSDLFDKLLEMSKPKEKVVKNKTLKKLSGLKNKTRKRR